MGSDKAGCLSPTLASMVQVPAHTHVHLYTYACAYTYTAEHGGWCGKKTQNREEKRRIKERRGEKKRREAEGGEGKRREERKWLKKS